MTIRRAGELLSADSPWSLELFGSFRLSRTGKGHKLRTREQRLIALLALHGGRRRSYLAGMLWPESTEAHAGANLRAATYRVDHVAPGLLVHDRREVALGPGVDVDIQDFVDYVCRVSADPRQGLDSPGDDPASALPVLLHGDLLPGWYDDWVIYERARLQQLRIQALEVAAARMMERGEIASALVAASAAVAVEPLRESAQRILVRVHLKDGNYHAALHAYHDFRARIRRELGIAPSGQMQDLVRPLLQHLHSVSGRLSDSLPGLRQTDTQPAGHDNRQVGSRLADPARRAI